MEMLTGISTKPSGSTTFLRGEHQSESCEVGTLRAPSLACLALNLCLANLNWVSQYQKKQVWASFLLVFITTIFKYSLIINLDCFSGNFLVVKKMNNSSLQL